MWGRHIDLLEKLQPRVRDSALKILRSSKNLCCEVCLWDTSDAMMKPDGLKCNQQCRVCPGRLSLPRQDRQRNAALLAFSVFSELKHVFLVDEDVDIFDMSDVMWAMTTRFQADVDMISIPGCHCHVLDPSNDHALDPSIRVHGIACKAIFDCTVPFDQKENFVRSNFMEIDKDKWAKELAF